MIPKVVLATLVGLSCTATVLAQARPTNTLRIEPVGDGEGETLQLEGFHHIGSPCYSKDSEWIAFDGYKGANAANITSECWVVRSDGTDARRLGSCSAFHRARSRVPLGRPLRTGTCSTTEHPSEAEEHDGRDDRRGGDPRCGTASVRSRGDEVEGREPERDVAGEMDAAPETPREATQEH